MNIKRFATLVLVILFAAPFAAFGYEVKAMHTTAKFEESFVMESDLGLISLRVENVKRVGTAQVGNIDIGSERYIVRQFNNQRTVEHLSLNVNDGSHDCDLRDTNGLTITNFGGNIEFPSVRPMTAPLTPQIIRHLILYEPSAATQAGGTEILLAEIQWGIAQLRRTLDNSGEAWVQIDSIVLPFPHDVPRDDWWAGDDPEVERFRFENYAHLVTFVVDDWGAGGSSEMFTNGNPDHAYNVVNRIRIFQGSFTHEFGHLQGKDHNLETAGGVPPGVPEYNRSMEICFENSIENVTGIMSTSSACTDGSTRIELFTGDGVVYNGMQFSAPNARQAQVAEVTMPIIANYVGDPPNTGPCVPDDTTMCLDSSNGSGDKRFEIRVSFETTLNGGQSGFGLPTMLSDSTESGLFSFFAPSNKEMLIKVINACSFNEHFWVFFGTTTNVGFSVLVRDTLLDNTWSHENEDLTAGQVQDINALPCN